MKLNERTTAHHAYLIGTFTTRRAAIMAANDHIRDRNRPAGTPSRLWIIVRGGRRWEVVTGHHELTGAGVRFYGPITDANLNAYREDFGCPPAPILPDWVGARI